MRERTKKTMNEIRKALPWVFCLIYVAVLGSFIKAMAGVLTGEELLEPSYVYTNSQLTAYVQILYVGLGVVCAVILVRLAITPDRTKAYRIRILENKVIELEKKIQVIENEGDNGDSGKGHDAGKGVETERIEEKDAVQMD